MILILVCGYWLSSLARAWANVNHHGVGGFVFFWNRVFILVCGYWIEAVSQEKSIVSPMRISTNAQSSAVSRFMV